jgi:hypothetical protein
MPHSRLPPPFFPTTASGKPMVNPWLLVPAVNFFDTGSLPFSSNAGIYCFDSALTLRDEIAEYFRHEPVSTAW